MFADCDLQDTKYFSLCNCASSDLWGNLYSREKNAYNTDQKVFVPAEEKRNYPCWTSLKCDSKPALFFILKSMNATITLLIQGVFFTWPPPKKLKYGKPRLGEEVYLGRPRYN